MNEELIELLKKKEIQITIMNYEDMQLQYTYNNDRLFFFCNIDNEADELLEYNNLIASFISQDTRRFFGEIGIAYSKEKTVIDSIPDVKSLLWDLYTIGIHLEQEDNSLKLHKKSEIERNMLISRKKFIEGKDNIEIADKINKLVLPQNDFDDMFSNTFAINDENDIVTELISGNNEDDIKLDVDWKTYKDILKFLKSIK